MKNPNVKGWVNQSTPWFLKSLLSLHLGYFIGFLAIAQANMILLVGLFITWFFIPSFTFRSFLIIGYFLGATSGIPESFNIYNNTDQGFAVYLIQALVLSLFYIPFAKYKSGILIGSILMLFNPIGWTNPLILSALVFPAAGMVSILAFLFFYTQLEKRWIWFIMLLTSLLLNANQQANKLDQNHTLIQTHYQKPMGAITSKEIERRGLLIADYLEKDVHHKTLYFPETHLVERESTQWVIELWQEVSDKLNHTIISGFVNANDHNQILIIKPNEQPIILNAQASAIVPDKDNPFKNAGAPWQLSDQPAIYKDTLLLVCYEEYHLGLMLWKMHQHHNHSGEELHHLVSLQNLWWSNSGTNSMVRVQRLYGYYLARLFGLSYQYAANGG